MGLERKEDLLAVWHNLVEEAQKNSIILDQSAYADQLVGLPYCIPFIVRRNNKS